MKPGDYRIHPCHGSGLPKGLPKGRGVCSDALAPEPDLVRWNPVTIGWFLLLLSVLLLALLRATPVRAAGVVGTGTPESCTEAALEAALTGGGAVTFNCGPRDATITVTSTKTITQNTSLNGARRITISADDAVLVFRVEGAALSLANLTLAHGKGDRGGGVFNDGTLTVTWCTFSDNYANEGAAIYNNEGRTVTVTNTTFSTNGAAASAGAILNASGSVTVKGSTFSGNTSTVAGAIANFGGTLMVTESTFSANNVSTAAGAILSAGNPFGRASMTVVNSTFSGNSANQGGAVVNVDGDLIITNCTFAGNTGEPGAIDNSGQTATATITNSIVTDSTDSKCAGVITDGGHNLQWPGTDCGATIAALDPMLDPDGLQDNGGPTPTVALVAGSPAIGAGDPEVCANPPVNGVDQRGYPRPSESTTNCSIGAYEHNSPSLPPKVVGTGTPESCTEAALEAALPGDGLITFDCGPEPVTIRLGGGAVYGTVTMDGGGLVTLSGGNTQRLFRVYDSAILTLRNVTIANGNTGVVGGAAILNRGARIIVINSTLRDNVAAGPGAGILNYDGQVMLNRSTASGNSSGEGGAAIYNSGGTLTVINSTVSGNHAQLGGAILNDTDGTVTLINATLAANDATTIANNAGTVSLTNSIIAVSGGQACSGPITDGGHNVQWPGTDCGATMASVDPLLVPAGLEDNGGATQTIALLAGSPAIDGGDREACADPPVNGVDQRGYVRPGTGYANCSIGAYEHDSPGPSPSCVGDCYGDDEVTVAELITMVSITLGSVNVAACHNGDANVDGDITVDEIITAVNRALRGCGVPDVSGTRRRDEVVIRSSTCDAAVTARVQDSIDAGNWNCTYEILQSGQDLTLTESCPDGTDTFFGTVDGLGRVTSVRSEQETEDTCTVTTTSRFEVDASASSSTGVGRLRFKFSAGCAFSDCEMVVESRFVE
jgi:hypothetical protein